MTIKFEKERKVDVTEEVKEGNTVQLKPEKSVTETIAEELDSKVEISIL